MHSEPAAGLARDWVLASPTLNRVQRAGGTAGLRQPDVVLFCVTCYFHAYIPLVVRSLLCYVRLCLFLHRGLEPVTILGLHCPQQT